MLIRIAMLKRKQSEGSTSLTSTSGQHTNKGNTAVGVTALGAVEEVYSAIQPRVATGLWGVIVAWAKVRGIQHVGNLKP